MTQRIINDAAFAKTVWHLYREYGLGQYANWLTMQKASVERDEVVAALRFPETQRAAEKLVKFYRHRISEIESMLSDAS